jgi:MFS family permease
MLKHKVCDSPKAGIQLTWISGFTNDIGAQPNDLNLAVSLFFITFVLFQPISSAVGRRVGAKHWIPVIMVC